MSFPTINWLSFFLGILAYWLFGYIMGMVGRRA